MGGFSTGFSWGFQRGNYSATKFRFEAEGTYIPGDETRGTMKRKRVNVVEGSTVVTMGRLRDVAGVHVTVGSVEELSAIMVNETTDESVAVTEATINNCLFPTMQTDVRWKEDSIGYNFAIVIDGNYFADGDTPYRLEVTIKTTGQPAFKEFWTYQTLQMKD